MDWNKHKSLSGVYALSILIISTVIFSLLWPEYDHSKQSFSELGATNAPHFIPFNIVSFGIVGIISIFYAIQIKSFFGDVMDRWMYYTYLLTCGSWILIGIVPASFQSTLLYNLHLAAAFIAYVFGAVNIMLSIKLFNLVKGYEFFSLVSVLFMFGVWLSIFLSFSGIGLTPEWGQLISIFSYFVWQAIYSYKFYLNTK